jgi:hypothetical protein
VRYADVDLIRHAINELFQEMPEGFRSLELLQMLRELFVT